MSSPIRPVSQQMSDLLRERESLKRVCCCFFFPNLSASKEASSPGLQLSVCRLTQRTLEKR